ncbi:hypothetical protein H2198_001723 [Neophaeococcomyces mojaviensis]|uniref:Uncharacterized protein n=1 Tax=Neophaeococcomyces mojaviensis TaxID=3383035 RepID=A0ACC3AGJ0_9EURO|nr:hypothetical protein H2198_001723 [Knufia sp. JES_112]
MGSPNHEHKTQEQEHQVNNHENGSRDPPPPPEPSRDAGIVPPIQSPTLEGLDHLTPENIDIFTLDPVAALKLLCEGTQLLVDMTGDIPPTPPVRSRGSSPPGHGRQPARDPTTTPPKQNTHLSVVGFTSRNENDHIDGVPFVRTPIGSPEAFCHEPIVHGDTSQSAAIQSAALARKFYSKRPPPISLDDYLSRMHKYCPMSTAVYLATSHYISYLAVREKLLPVTTRNVHRLVLAGLRVAMKALEDLSWPHGRFAKVGGISEAELGKLEVGFCFLMDFGLKVDAQMLTDEAQNLVRIHNSSAIEEGSDVGGMHLSLPEPRQRQPREQNADATSASGGGSGQVTPRTAEKRKASSSLPMRPVQVGQGIGIVGQS